MSIYNKPLPPNLYIRDKPRIKYNVIITDHLVFQCCNHSHKGRQDTGEGKVSMPAEPGKHLQAVTYRCTYKNIQ